MAGSNLTILAKGTYIQGEVFSEDMLVVEGGFEGNLVGDRVIIKSSGQVQGDLNCRSLSIEKGGILNGDIRVLSDLAALPDPSTQPAPKAMPPQPAIPEPAVPEPVAAAADQVMDIGDLEVKVELGIHTQEQPPEPPDIHLMQEEAESAGGASKASGKKNAGKQKNSKSRLFGGSLFKK